MECDSLALAMLWTPTRDVSVILAKTVLKKGKGKVSKSETQETKKKKKKRHRSVKILGVATSKVVGRPKNCLPRDLSQPTIMEMAMIEK